MSNLFPVAVASQAKDLIALSNSRQPVGIVIIDYEGNLVDRVGSKGRGPAEILTSFHFGFDTNNNIVINDKSLSTIKKFDRTKQSVETYNSLIPKGISISSRRLKYCSGFWYMGVDKLNALPTPQTPIVVKLNNDFEVVEKFGNYDPHFKGNK